MTGAASTILCTTAGSRVSAGDQITARFGRAWRDFLIEGNNVATQPCYFGIVSSPIASGVDVARSTDINVLCEGTQNGTLHINSYYGPTLYKIDRGSFTNWFPKIEGYGSTRYFFHFAGNAGNLGLLSYTGHNRFDLGIGEGAEPGMLLAVLHEAGFRNKLVGCTLSDSATLALPTFVKITKATASPSVLFLLQDLDITANVVGNTTVAIDIGAGCSAIFDSHVGITGARDGVRYADSAVVYANVDPTMNGVTNHYVSASGTPAFKSLVFRDRRATPRVLILDSVADYADLLTVVGEVHSRTLNYPGALHHGTGATAPVQVVGARQAAIANAGAGTEVATINSILTALRTHGLIAT